MTIRDYVDCHTANEARTFINDDDYMLKCRHAMNRFGASRKERPEYDQKTRLIINYMIDYEVELTYENFDRLWDERYGTGK